MQYDVCDWDDAPRANVDHVADNGVTKEEWQEVLDSADPRDVEPSESDPDHWTYVGETRRPDAPHRLHHGRGRRLRLHPADHRVRPDREGGLSMDPTTKAQLDKLSPEKRAKAEALMAKHRTPEARAKEEAAREDYDRQMRETGTIRTAPRPDVDLAGLGSTLRERRRAAGLSLDDVAARSGIGRSAVAAIERGGNGNPTVSTLGRVAAAVGGRITIGFESADASSSPVLDKN